MAIILNKIFCIKSYKNKCSETPRRITGIFDHNLINLWIIFFLHYFKIIFIIKLNNTFLPFIT